MGLENHRCRYGRLRNVLAIYSLQLVITQRIKTSPMMLCIVGFLFFRDPSVFFGKTLIFQPQ